MRRRSLMVSAVIVAVTVVGSELVLSTAAFAATPIVLGSTADSYQVLPHADFLEDPEGKLSIDDVTHGMAARGFQPFQNKLLKRRAISGWLRFALQATGGTSKSWILALGQYADVANLYYPSGGGYRVERFGMEVPFRDRPYRDVPVPAFPIHDQYLNGQPLFLYVRWNGIFPLSVVIRAQQGLLADDLHTRTLDAFIIGLFLAIALSNFFLFLSLRSRKYVVYTLAVLVFALQIVTRTGYPWQYIWPWAATGALPVAVYSNIAYWLALVMFCRTFLETKTRLPRLDKILVGVWALVAARQGLLLVLPSVLEFGRLTAPLNLILAALIVTVAAVALSRGFRPARFFLIGSFIYLIAITTYFHGIYYAGIHAFNPFATLEAQADVFGLVVDTLMLTFALADQLITANRERNAAQLQTVRTQAESIRQLEIHNRSVARFVPTEFLHQLGRSSVVDLSLGDHAEREMTILFSDIRSFTAMSESMTPGELFAFINAYLGWTSPLITEQGGIIDKYIGDAIMGLFPNAVEPAVEAAIALQRGVREFNEQRAVSGQPPIAIGVGLHRGRLMLGAIGTQNRIDTTVISDVVNVASRVEGLTKVFRASVIASDAVMAELQHPRDRFRPLGRVQVKGTSHPIAIYELFDSDPPDLQALKSRTLSEFHAGIDAFTAGKFEAASTCFEKLLAFSPWDATAASFYERCTHMVSSDAAANWDGVIYLDAK